MIPEVTTEASVLATAISYAEDQAMAGAYFPEWQSCADMLRRMCVHRGILLPGSPRGNAQ